MSAITFKDRALPLIKRNVPVMPLLPRTKIAAISDWPNKASTDLAQIEQWNAENPDANCASVAFAKPGHIWILELDSAAARQRIIDENPGKDFPQTYAVKSSDQRGHFYFRQTDASIALGNLAQGFVKFGDWSARVHNQYAVSANSVHPKTGQPYEVKIDGEILPAPQWLIDWCRSQKIEPKTTDSSEPEEIIEGGRNNKLASIAGKLRYEGLDREEILQTLLLINEKRCKPPLPQSEVETITGSVARYRVGDPALKSPLLFNGVEGGKSPHIPRETAPVQTAQPVTTEPERLQFAISDKEKQAEYEKEYPVIPLANPVGPEWHDSILYGIAGDIVRKASEYSEGHPVGMQLDLLVGLGNIIGRGPYFTVNATKHFTNEFLCKVGESSRSKKGTARDQVNEILLFVDHDWSRKCTQKGFGSGEAIVYGIRDSFEQQVFRKGQHERVVVPGVPDKRMMIRESELASVFLLCGKKDSRADVIIRDGWDSQPLENKVKGKGQDGLSQSCRCEEPHVSISGDTTKSELMRKMPTGSDENGFGNRFLYCYVYRTQFCPNGGPSIDFSKELQYLREAVLAAKNTGLVSMTNSARQWWNNNYEQFEEPLPGQAGKMTSRAAPHVKRLAMIYALLDKTDKIETKHFQAAFELWNYCADSALFIFNKTLKTCSEDQKIIDFLTINGASSATELTQHCFHRNHRFSDVETLANQLVERGVLVDLDGIYALKAA